MDRRRFLRWAGVAGASTVAAPKVCASEAADSGQELLGILMDTTQCAGCRNCETVCAEANKLPAPNVDDMSVLDKRRDTSETQFTVVNRYKTSAGEFYARRQCMHCVQPACASACLTKAMHKNVSGPVTWDESKCMGCRFCMVSCPFDIPKFEYNSAVPKIQKCSMCFKRLEAGQKPACVENCPAEALVFGKRRDLLQLAKSRIAQKPKEYVAQIYGDHDVGGTGWMFLAAAPFEELGFKVGLGQKPYPELTTGFLYSVPLILTLWPGFLLGLNQATKPDEGEE